MNSANFSQTYKIFSFHLNLFQSTEQNISIVLIYYVLGDILASVSIV
jgi:hypothetical protein